MSPKTDSHLHKCLFRANNTPKIEVTGIGDVPVSSMGEICVVDVGSEILFQRKLGHIDTAISNSQRFFRLCRMQINSELDLLMEV